MAKLLQTLIPILFLLAAAATTARSQRTSFHYDFHALQSTGLTFQGDAGYLLGSTLLPLTGATNGTVGRVLYTNPVQFWQADGQVNFETTFTFIITPLEGQPPADGLVFFIAPVGSTPPNGAGGGNFGVFDASGKGPEVFAVEFDTYINEWDPNYRHIGIDLGSEKSSNTTKADGIVGQAVRATIRYFGATGMISVTATNSMQETFEVSYVCDLSSFLRQQVQVGLSASTGQQVAFHGVYSWSFAAEMVNTGATIKSRKPFIRQFV